MKETQIHKLKMYHRIILFVVALCCTLSSHAVTYPSSPYISTSSGHSGGTPRVTAYSGYQPNYTPQSPLSSPVMLLSDGDVITSDNDDDDDDEEGGLMGGGTGDPGGPIPVGTGWLWTMLLAGAYALRIRLRQQRHLQAAQNTPTQSVQPYR